MGQPDTGHATFNQSEWLIPENVIRRLQEEHASLIRFRRSTWEPSAAAGDGLQNISFSSRSTAPAEVSGSRIEPLHAGLFSSPRRGLVWLHGIWPEFVSHDSGLSASVNPDEGGITVVRPKAPKSASSYLEGAPAFQWFDVSAKDDPLQVCVGCPQSIDDAMHTVEKEIATLIEKGIPETQIVIGGFSQGGALAVHVALHSKYNLAGVVGWAGYMCDGRVPKWVEEPQITHRPVVELLHGEKDELVPISWGDKLYENLANKDWQIPHVRLHKFNSEVGHVQSLSVVEMQLKMKEMVKSVFDTTKATRATLNGQFQDDASDPTISQMQP